MSHITRVATTKDEAAAILKIPVGRRWKKDHWEDDEAYEEMIVAKTRLLKDYPFWGILGMQLTVVEDTSGYITTLATDGRHLFYSAEFVMKLQRNERLFGVGHEILHALYEHAGKHSRAMAYTEIDPNEKDPEKIREANEKLQLANFAQDFIVNDDLVVGNVGEYITTVPVLHDTKFRGWSWEEVYDYLLKHPEERPDAGKQFDQHIEIEIVDDDEEDEGCEGERQPGDGKGPLKIKMKRSEADKLAQQWKDNVVRAAAAQKEAEERGDAAGSLPAGVQRFLDELVKPVVNWKQLLRRYVMQTMTYDFSFSRPNKALFNDGWTIPGFRNPNDLLDIVIAVDTSGSISRDQLTTFVSEMDGIMKSFPSYVIKAWCFEGAVVEDSVVTITRVDGHMEDITKFIEKVGGGGGTDFECNWEFMRDERIKPKLFLFLTDGMPFGSWGWPTYCPTIFLIMGNPGTTAPFGMTLHYEDAFNK